MNNSTQTTEDNSELAYAQKLNNSGNPTTPEQQAGWAQIAAENGVQEQLNSEIKNEVDAATNDMNMASLSQGEIAAVAEVAKSDGNFSVKEAADIGTGLAASKAVSAPDTSQTTIDNLYNTYGDQGLEAAQIAINGGNSTENLELVGQKIAGAQAPEKTADEMRTDLTAKTVAGDSLSDSEQAAADALGVETEQAEDEESLEAIEEQIAELQEKMKADGEKGIIQFEDVTKMGELKDKLMKKKVEDLSSGISGAPEVVRLDADINKVDESVAALEAQAKRIAEEAERLAQETEQKVA
jgi:hypothetical protein